MNIGKISDYVVDRETNLGYILIQDNQEYFLHHNECDGNYYRPGDKVKAFLYFDKMKRVAATIVRPKITMEKGGLCEVVGTAKGGVFVNIGISRDIFLSEDDMMTSKWPQIGDFVCATLKIKSQGLMIKLLNKYEILELKTGTLEVDQKYEGYVYRITENGVNIVTTNYNVVFVYYKNLRKTYRLGEKVDVKITKQNEDDFTGTLIEQKEIMMKDDTQTILDYLIKHHGVMNLTSDSSPEIIYNIFKMSKASFKRALGNLYKEKKVLLEENKTILVDYLNYVK